MTTSWPANRLSTEARAGHVLATRAKEPAPARVETADVVVGLERLLQNPADQPARARDQEPLPFRLRRDVVHEGLTACEPLRRTIAQMRRRSERLRPVKTNVPRYATAMSAPAASTTTRPAFSPGDTIQPVRTATRDRGRVGAGQATRRTKRQDAERAAEVRNADGSAHRSRGDQRCQCDPGETEQQAEDQAEREVEDCLRPQNRGRRLDASRALQHDEAPHG